MVLSNRMGSLSMSRVSREREARGGGYCFALWLFRGWEDYVFVMPRR
jgi:hypothetical protein